MVDRLKRKEKGTRLKKLVDGTAATRPVTIIVNGNKAARHDSIVEPFETQFDGFVPVGVDV